jgi:coenzyme F420-0:L-glutamate ligase / coenzyme F420-1:gamma-L-glutamate ligase
MALTLTPLPGIPLVSSGDDLVELILASLHKAGISLESGDILALAQKIVSKSEGRFRNLLEIQPGPRAVTLAREVDQDPRLVEVILNESRKVLRTRPGTLIVEHRLGFVCANAGVDHSNVRGEGTEEGEWILLLPKDPDRSAASLRERLESVSGVYLGVMIVDSHGRAWRLGTTGMAIGLSGVPGVVDLRGTQDLFGYTLRVTQVGAADELAAGASLVMGQASEATPVVHVRGFPYPLRDSSLGELLRPLEEDLFR